MKGVTKTYDAATGVFQGSVFGVEDLRGRIDGKFLYCYVLLDIVRSYILWRQCNCVCADFFWM